VDFRISARALTQELGGWRTIEPAYEALADAVRLLCLENRIAPRTSLPAERELATALGVSRATVAAAYRSLRGSGTIESIRGSGSTTLPVARQAPGRAFVDDGSIDLQQASPPAWPGLAGVIGETAADAASLAGRRGYDILGREELRRAIADRYTSQGVTTEPDQVLVTTGAQSAIHLVAALLVGPGDRVAIETPTYPHAAEAFRRAGGRLVGLPVSAEEGWDLDSVSQAFARTLPVLAYLMPDFQNPTGRTMTEHERWSIQRFATDAGSIVVVDETTADLDIDRSTTPTPFGLSGRAQILRIGSLGKSVWGGLRIGWIRADAAMIRRLAMARSAHDLGTPELEQAVAGSLLPRMDEILRQRSHLLRLGRDVLVSALSEHRPEWRIPDTRGGVSLWVDLTAPLSSRLVMDARAHGVQLSAGPRFSVDGGHESRLRIPFTAPADELSTAVRVLAASWDRVLAGAPSVAREMIEAVV
jgi:DNA-binding transcriptional MocR family regulator